MIYAEVLGDPIAQSKSPAIHGFWLQRLGKKADYHPTKVSADELSAHLKRRREDPGWRGCNLTMPLKEAAVGLVDSLSPTAQAIGAVNLITRTGAGLYGDNVDGAGFLESALPLADRHRIHRAILIGAGGAARGIAHALHDQGFQLDIVARDPSRAASVIRDLKISEARALPLKQSLPLGATPTLLINATPLGMRGFPELDLDLAALPEKSLVVDIVTDPFETRLLKTAKACGLTTLNGLHMLIGQAALSFASLFGVRVPREVDGELYERLSQ